MKKINQWAEIRIFDMDGGVTWIAAAHLGDAFKAYKEYLEDCGAEETLEDYSLDDAKELSNVHLCDLTYQYANGGTCSFPDRLSEMVECGAGFPCLFATSEY